MRFAFKLRFGFLVLVLFCCLGCEDEVQYSSTYQREVVASFLKNAFKGEKAANFKLISKKDRERIQAPLLLKNKGVGSSVALTTVDLKGEDLFQIVEAINPYNVKDLVPHPQFEQPPSEGAKSQVTVVTYRNIEKKFDLIWEDKAWRIDLNLK